MTIPTNRIPRNEYVFLDTNVLIFSSEESKQKDRGYLTATGDLLVKLKEQGNKLVVSDVVQYEILCQARTMKQYKKVFEKICDEYYRYQINERIVDGARKLHFLYGQNGDTKNYATRDNIFRDLLIGVSAGKRQIEDGGKSKILSADHDFCLPYFHPISIFQLEHSNNPLKMQRLYLYEVVIAMANHDWQNQLSNSN